MLIMKLLQSIIIVNLFFFVTACSNRETQQDKGLLIDPENFTASSLVASEGVQAKFLKNGDNFSLHFTCDGQTNSPYVIIHDRAKKWRLSHYHYLAADITNPGNDSVLAEIRLNADGWLNQGIVIPAGATGTIRIDIPQDSLPAYYAEKIIGMYNLPDGIIKTDNKTDSIHKISFLIICPSKETTIDISNIRGEGVIKYPSVETLDGDYYPLVDEFGQYRHADWTLKTHSLDELKKSAEIEEIDIRNHPKPTEWDKYGGWLKGPRLNATGNFRTEKVKGKWWLVDPDGYLFWSHGIGSVDPGGGNAVITDREFYFTPLPDSVKYREFYFSRWKAPFGYYKNKETRSFDEIGWNMMHKYGDSWKTKEINLAPVRLFSWGQNTLGAWTSPEIFLESKIPYTPIIMIGSRKLDGSEGHWYKYADPYDKSLTANLTLKIRAIEKSTIDPFCIGYFVDNEITWGDTTSVARWTIASSPGQPAKVVMLDFLKKRYRTIDKMNAKWGTGFESWNDFMNNTRLLDIRNDDTKEFTLMAINEYFRQVKNTLQKLAPGKLYLGPRLDFHFYPSENGLNDWDFRNDWIVNIAAGYCDVVSFNRYRHSAADLRPGDSDKPVIVGEWHHVPLEKGSFYMDQEHFAESLCHACKKIQLFHPKLS